MMAGTGETMRLLDRLPKVRGRYSENAALGPFTWFRVGGPADILFRPADREDLAEFLRRRPAEIPVTVIGVGSNLLIRDGGVRGVVIRLGRSFAEIDIEPDAVYAGAGALDLNVALASAEAGLGGLEFLSGIPGTLGGALKMNAGAFGRELKDVLIEAEAVDGSGRALRLEAAELGLSYRHSDAPDDWIFTAAKLRANVSPRDAIRERIEDIRREREASQPVRVRTGGSTFANPPGEKAWRLIDRAGCRGLTRGGAMVSEKHCNFLINTGNATAAELEALGEEVRARVKQQTGVDLRWEIVRIGEVKEGRA
jgi:UDP-N-acetylmuramate dehydrogenase